MDSQGIWYRSTILATNTIKKGEADVKEVSVGFRYYDEEEGHKTDDKDGRKYVGWSSSYDENKSVTCPTI
jgi:phage head maturation protease